MYVLSDYKSSTYSLWKLEILERHNEETGSPMQSYDPTRLHFWALVVRAFRSPHWACSLEACFFTEQYSLDCTSPRVIEYFSSTSLLLITQYSVAQKNRHLRHHPCPDPLAPPAPLFFPTFCPPFLYKVSNWGQALVRRGRGPFDSSFTFTKGLKIKITDGIPKCYAMDWIVFPPKFMMAPLGGD